MGHLVYSNSCLCNLHPRVTKFEIYDNSYSICNLPLVPSWILAVFIGLYIGNKLASLGQHVTGSLAYSITYYMYAVMISSGIVVHCLFLVECGAQSTSKYYIDSARIDASLTSCIAVSFLFNGLIDLKLINERSCVTMMSMLLSYGTIFYAYFSEWATVLDLYWNSVVVCCPLYMVTQVVCIIKEQSANFSDISLFIGAGLVGGSSLLIVREKYCWLCQIFGPWSVEGVWYYGSDITMILLGAYIWKSRSKITINCTTLSSSK